MDRRTVGVVVGLVTLAFGAVVVLGGGAALWWWWTKLRGGEVAELARRLPASTDALWAARGFGDLAVEFRGLAAQSDGPSPEVLEQFHDTFGFYPNDPEGWASTGLDFTRPWGLAVQGVGDVGEAEVTLLFPVADEERALATAQRLLVEESGQAVTPATFGSHAGFTVGESAAMALSEGHLVLVGSDRRGYDAGTAMRVFLDRDGSDSLWEAPAFRAVLDALPDRWHALSYGSPALVAKAWEDADAQAREVFGALGRGGVGGTLTLEDEGLSAETVLLAEGPLTPVLAGGPDPLADRVSGTPLAVGRLGLDWKAAWAALRADPEVAAQLDDAGRDLRDEWGVDLEADVVGNLSGPLTVVTLPGAETPELAAWVKVKDSARAGSLLDAVTARLRGAELAVSTDRSEGQVWHHKDAAAVGLVGDTLVLALGKGRREALVADLGGKAEGFARALPAPVREQLRAATGVFLYLDVAAVLRSLGQNPLTSRWVGREVRQARFLVSGISVGLDAEDSAVRVRSAIYPVNGSFTAASQGLLAEQARQAEHLKAREAVLANLDRLRDAELAYMREHGEYLECGSEPEGMAQARGERPWKADDCWRRLGFTPAEPVPGGYWVKASGGWVASFRAYGALDRDGDGEAALLTADPFRGARLTTDAEVY